MGVREKGLCFWEPHIIATSRFYTSCINNGVRSDVMAMQAYGFVSDGARRESNVYRGPT